MVVMVPCSCVAFLCPEPNPKWFLLSDLLRAKISQFPRHVKAIQARIVMNLQLYDHIIGSHGARLATPRGRFDLKVFSPALKSSIQRAYSEGKLGNGTYKHMWLIKGEGTEEDIQVITS